jgi:uncharacterized protein YbjT (DUF2867 family)
MRGLVARNIYDVKQPGVKCLNPFGRPFRRPHKLHDCEVALATIDDVISLAAAFRGAESVFVLVPPNFDPLPEFPEAQAIRATSG